MSDLPPSDSVLETEEVARIAEQKMLAICSILDDMTLADVRRLVEELEA